MARKKSLIDIYNQQERLWSALANSYGNPRTQARLRKINAAADAYTDRIMNTKSFKKGFRIGEDNDKLMGRKYSQSTYMGNANG